MDIFSVFKISSSALTAQQTRLNAISSNLANVETTSTPEGGPYRKKSVVFKSDSAPFSEQLDQQMKGVVQGVRVTRIVTDSKPPRNIYNPSHPDADDKGYVAMPNVDVMEEMADMLAASRAYEANVNTIQAAKRMALKTLEIGR